MYHETLPVLLENGICSMKTYSKLLITENVKYDCLSLWSVSGFKTLQNLICGLITQVPDG